VVLEAQYQDAVRLEIDNLYTAYVDVLNARETVRSVAASLEMLDRTLKSIEDQHQKGELPGSAVDDAVVQRDTAALAHDQAVTVLRQTKRTLATLLAIPPAEADRIEVRGTIRDEAPPPPCIFTAASWPPILAPCREECCYPLPGAPTPYGRSPIFVDPQLAYFALNSPCGRPRFS
jgi:outer membrane protein TolC